MKPTNLITGRMLMVLLILGLTIGLASFGYKQSPGQYQQLINDTIPKKKTGGDKEKKVRDLDDVLDEMDKADLKLDMEKIQKEISEAI